MTHFCTKEIKKKIIFQPNKILGQNFLFDKNYLQKIVAICPINSDTVIIEIGSGYGDLTNELVKTNCKKIIGLEKDKKLFQWLEKKNKSERIIYLWQDALSIDWEKFCLEYKDSSIVVIGNLPYCIANSLIINLLFQHHLFKYFVFLVQKEVGQKWVSSSTKYSSKYSALSIFINYLAETKLVFEIPRNIFKPVPSVDGSLVTVKPWKDKNVCVSKQQLVSFLKFLKNCFFFRRKTLWNNLLAFSGDREKDWKKYFYEKNYSTKIRSQNLTVEDHRELFLYWKKILKKNLLN
ncbi:16S rRNA (adenine(1518)-N(6)/adenine(1519)-N(6))-dimethyltransferase RsmA [endosymbiont GvMRE of Glomus versiforme]|uniref:16S rRNA (adenine(1518)-N(6)/adenine(1519)-N(6))- dimethyltransferase RsmA n=1 Tax=endosymbiont GvMRE of Glomus versiforme TaxID=2039283 RepID=UPI000EB8EE7A|nr:16S rRNA (adenine(1518)-N(6)/adenine(1519)-N(6))-dimethyltransferase RsmA [endosymbiont GvMRE of Glomus versiforme]RHZ35359.1 Ribosomal RNA small subunit methyltransferase A [endosymbiont GvMRE of Glomus versiforme]